MALSEVTRAARRADLAIQIVRDLETLYRTHEKLRQNLTKFIAQDLHKSGVDETQFANDDTAVDGNHDVVWSELYDANDISNDFAALFLNQGTATLTAADRETIAKKRGFDLP